MANDFFKFKQFVINQSDCAMKVGTDGVLLGAWVNLPTEGTVLDVGTGTGLLSLMITQRSNLLKIDAVEIDEVAVNQAQQNVNQSPWKERINVICADFFDMNIEKKYDLIICNPPFYKNSPKSSAINRDMARSQICFDIKEFISKSASLLTENGKLAFIVPSSLELLIYSYLDENNLLKRRICKVQPIPSKPVHRLLLEATFGKREMEFESLIIEEFGRHQYSEMYKQLVKEFLL